MKHEIAINRSLGKVDPRRIPRDPIAPTAPPECEAYALGHDARNDLRPIDENPYDGILECLDNIDWAQGWADADREREADDEGGD
jgi:hypothetical protein